MPSVDPRARPSGGDPRPWIEAWVSAPELLAAIAAFGGEPRGDRDLLAWLQYLEGFSDRWEFRHGNERNLVVDPNLTPEQDELAFTAADALGLRGLTEPAHTDYDAVVILGGLVRACFARPQHAARLLADGHVQTRRVIGLGGSRPLRGDEHELLDRLLGIRKPPRWWTHPIAWFRRRRRNEFKAMDTGLREAFGLQDEHAVEPEPRDLLANALKATNYRDDRGLPVHVVAAPPLDPSHDRANTAETYAWLAERPHIVKPGQRLLIVTTAIYAPYQHADALRMFALPHGFEIDTIGMEPGEVDPRLHQPFAGHAYLQEIRSTFRSLRMLLEAA